MTSPAMYAHEEIEDNITWYQFKGYCIDQLVGTLEQLIEHTKGTECTCGTLWEKIEDDIWDLIQEVFEVALAECRYNLNIE